MADNLELRLSGIAAKAAMLTERYRLLQEAKAQADVKIEELEATVERQARDIEHLERQVEYLQVVTTLCPDRESVIGTRALLAELVREIDKCINDLDQ